MTKGCKEADEKKVSLPEDDPDIFALYEQVVYTGHVPLFDDELERVEKDCWSDTWCEEDACHHEYEALCQLYLLAEKLQDWKVKNTAIKAIVSKVTHESTVVHNDDSGPCLPSPTAIKFMYEGTLGNCPGRQVLLDCYVWYGQDKSLLNLNDWKELPWKFLLDLAQDALAYCPHPTTTKFLPHNDIGRYLENDGPYEWGNEVWMDIRCYRDR
jgi:hypothetical protein